MIKILILWILLFPSQQGGTCLTEMGNGFSSSCLVNHLAMPSYIEIYIDKAKVNEIVNNNNDIQVYKYNIRTSKLERCAIVAYGKTEKIDKMIIEGYKLK